MATRGTCAPAWAFPTAASKFERNRPPLRGAKPRSHPYFLLGPMDCFASLAMTDAPTVISGIEYAFVEVRHRCLWRYRLHRPARRRISRGALYREVRSEMGEGRTQPGEAGIGARYDRRARRHGFDPGRRRRSRIAESDG